VKTIKIIVRTSSVAKKYDYVTVNYCDAYSMKSIMHKQHNRSYL